MYASIWRPALLSNTGLSATVQVFVRCGQLFHQRGVQQIPLLHAGGLVQPVEVLRGNTDVLRRGRGFTSGPHRRDSPGVSSLQTRRFRETYTHWVSQLAGTPFRLQTCQSLEPVPSNNSLSLSQSLCLSLPLCTYKHTYMHACMYIYIQNAFYWFCFFGEHRLAQRLI